MKFIAIDLETANADMSSICQIGIASFCDGELVSEWSSLINPNDYFSFINVDIHGISEKTVENSPTFSEVFPKIRKLLANSICICHTHFDLASLNQAIQKFKLPEIPCAWLDSSKIARRAWQEVAYSGYGLKNVCEIIGFQFRQHEANLVQNWP